MPAIHETAYPRLKSSYTEPALNQFYTPDEREVEWVHNKARLPWSRICLLTLLKTFQTLGYFPTWQDIPAQIIEHVSACCGLIFVPEVPTGYDRSGTRVRHMQHIRALLDIQAVGPSTEATMIEAAAHAAQSKERVADILNVMIEQLIRQRFELPGFSTLVKEARRARRLFNRHCYNEIANALSADQHALIDQQLLNSPPMGEQSLWYQLKHEPTKPTAKTLRRYTDHVNWLLHWRETLSAKQASPTTKLPAAKSETLGQIGDARAVEPLIEALRDSHWDVRRAAAEALGEIGDTRAVEPLIEALKDSKERVRWAIAIMLGDIGDARAVEPLIEALKDSDSRVQRTAAEALERLGWQPDKSEATAYLTGDH